MVRSSKNHRVAALVIASVALVLGAEQPPLLRRSSPLDRPRAAPVHRLPDFSTLGVWDISHRVAGDEQVTRARPSDGSPVATLPIRAGAMVLRADHAWLLSQDRALLEIDISTNQTLRTIKLGFVPTSIADAGGAFWITNFDGSNVIRVGL